LQKLYRPVIAAREVIATRKIHFNDQGKRIELTGDLHLCNGVVKAAYLGQIEAIPLARGRIVGVEEKGPFKFSSRGSKIPVIGPFDGSERGMRLSQRIVKIARSALIQRVQTA